MRIISTVIIVRNDSGIARLPKFSFYPTGFPPQQVPWSPLYLFGMKLRIHYMQVIQRTPCRV